jgi:hypothetical protein
MRKLRLFTLSMALVLLLAGCMSLASFFPLVTNPLSPQSSMLVVEVGMLQADGSSVSMSNTNATGWAPWVVDANGNVVPFKNFDAESRLDSFYFAENVPAGEYTLKGFYHVYIDYSKSKDGEVASYGPFENYPYHVKQEFALAQPVKLTLNNAEMATFGRYYVQGQWREGAAGTTDDRWAMNEATVKITGDPSDKKALRVAKNWATPAWSDWNTRNPETAADK